MQNRAAPQRGITNWPEEPTEKEKRPSCPFVNLPLPRGSKWSQRITASETKFCHWVESQLVCQAKFSELTRDERLRQPVFLGLREDKEAKEGMLENAQAI
jgi:bifunctional non-homologous end joining protein LigD